MRILGIAYSLSPRFPSKELWLAELYREIEAGIAAGSDVLVFPEFFLLGLAEYYPGEPKAQFLALAEDLEAHILPAIAQRFARKDLCLCLGSGPRLAAGKLRNSSPILLNGKWIYQDKIHLTPWETDFTPGNTIHTFEFQGLKTAVLICYDVEQPSLSWLLKQSGIDLLLVPSATADKNGSQRVTRCASARSIELGAAVLTVPLLGHSSCDLVDFSEGRISFFLPAQASARGEQEQSSSYGTTEILRASYSLEAEMMRAIKKQDGETKPYWKKEENVIIVPV